MSVKIAGGASSALAEVKAASALAVATDAAMVVMNRPDDPTFAPTFVIGAGGQLALNQNILLAVAGAGSYDTGNSRSLSLEIIPAAGTFTAGAITFEGSNDDANWVPMTMYDRSAPANTPVSTYTIVAATPRYFAGDVIWKKVRIRISTAITGTTTGVQAFSYWSQQDYTPSVFMVRLSDGTNVSPTGDAVARGIFVKPTDGTSAQAMKAASTPAAAADIGAVVTISPNLPVPSMLMGVAAASINATVVKATPGTLYGATFWNASAAIKYLKLYNKATAPAPATDAALLVKVIPLAAGQFLEIDVGYLGTRFAAGIAFATVTGAADTDATAVAVGDVRWTFNYV